MSNVRLTDCGRIFRHCGQTAFFEPESTCGGTPHATARQLTPEELQAALAEPRGPAPSRTLWLHASLLEEARRLWEMMSAELTSPQSPEQ